MKRQAKLATLSHGCYEAAVVREMAAVIAAEEQAMTAGSQRVVR